MAQGSPSTCVKRAFHPIHDKGSFAIPATSHPTKRNGFLMSDITVVRAPSPKQRRMNAIRIFIRLSQVRTNLDPELAVNIDDYIAELEN